MKEFLRPRGLIFISSLVLILLAGGLSYGAPGAASFSLTLDGKEFTPNDQINFTLALKNIGKAPIYVNKRFYVSSEEATANQKDVYLMVTAPSGAKLPCTYSYETGYPKTDYFQLLEPGAEVKSENPRNLKAFFNLEEMGTYKVVAVYQNVFGSEIGLDVFKEKLVSETVTFTIAKPEEKKDGEKK